MPGPMGGITHIFDSRKTGKSYKLGHKKHTDGFEAPRNSLDISINVSRGFHHYVSEEIPVRSHSSKMNYCSNEASMKKFIDGEISARTSESQAAPSVVARLMGMDSMPLERSTKVHAKEQEAARVRQSMEIISKPMESSSAMETSRSSTSSRQPNRVLLPNANRRDYKTERTRKPQPRKHPQEELLEKFKKEFEAWQASKLREHPGQQKNHNLGDGKDYRTLAQEVLNKEKMAKYMDTKKILAEKRSTESKEVSTAKQNVDTQQGSSLQNHGHLNKLTESFLNNSMTSKLGTRANDPEHLPVAKIDRKQGRSCSPTRIVILKPNFDRFDRNEEPFAAASYDKLGKECSMEDFLEEVKDRLRYEVQGNSGNNVKTRGSEKGTLFSERSVDPKRIARDIAKQIRESVTKDIGNNLMRSESTRSIRSDILMNTPDSPEFMRRDTRKFLSEKSKNVLKNDIVLKQPLVNHEDSVSSSLNKGKSIPSLMSDFSNKRENVEYWKEKKGVAESIPRHTEKFVALDADSASQINLIRSFSAPVSGTAFGKLLLEEQHISGAQIRRKHEASEHNYSEVRRQRKDSFNLRGTVSNLRHNLNLKGKLFGKKTRLIKEPIAGEFNSLNDIQTAPSVQENSTEVPPSPASVSSSSPDEFCRQDNPSPISPLEVMEYHTSPCISEELSSKSPEPVLSEKVEHGGPDTAVEEQLHKQETIEIESRDAVHLHDLLVTSGLYEDKSTDQANSRLDALTRPISHQIFEEVEEAYNKYGKVDTESSIIHNDDIAIGHKLLFDLVNEALQTVVGPKINCSMFKRWILGPAASPNGKSLLDDLWNQIQSYINPSLDESGTLERMVVEDLKTTTWPTMLYEDMDVVGRQIERVILQNLINDALVDFCS
ncbi:hypothetical protein Cni_G03490 [Canna indica]|uniref:DUF4378 domain-containing protein n=1 Tax=Canna indica TaxID=4628 RepID=A0AAQ3Q1A5_9LILI|nr:hypothetical protein Cni_G03490 [Canna indica]